MIPDDLMLSFVTADGFINVRRGLINGQIRV